MGSTHLLWALAADVADPHDRLALIGLADSTRDDDGGYFRYLSGGQWTRPVAADDRLAFERLAAAQFLFLPHGINADDRVATEGFLRVPDWEDAALPWLRAWGLAPASPRQRKPRSSGYRKHQRAVWDRDNWQCVWCGDHRNLTIDHKVPLAAGGTDDIDNLQTLCWTCNTDKGTKEHPSAARKAVARAENRPPFNLGRGPQ